MRIDTSDAATVRGARVWLTATVLSPLVLAAVRATGESIGSGVWQFRRALVLSMPPGVLFGFIAGVLILRAVSSSLATRSLPSWLTRGVCIGISLSTLWAYFWAYFLDGQRMALYDLSLRAAEGTVWGAAMAIYGFAERLTSLPSTRLPFQGGE